jgi:hypothetical protein
MLMKNGNLMRKQSWMAVASSLLTVIALVVAPICAPLCAARTCSSSVSSADASDHCHLAALSHPNSSRLHAVQNCAAAELPVALLRSTSESSALRSATLAATAPSAVSLEISSVLHLQRWSRCAGSVSLCKLDPLAATSVLRV